MNETAFESLPLHVGFVVVVVPPIVLVDVPPSGGLSTTTCNVAGCTRSAAGMVAVNCWLLTKVAVKVEPLKYTIDSLRK